MNRSLLLFSLFFSCITLSAQYEGANWHFGYRSALSFTSSPPTIVSNSSIHSFEACASISDQNGILQFYTSGDTVWNRQHQVMANGTGLFGHISATQGALAVRSPSNNSMYVLFTLDEGSNLAGFRYSIIDMSLAAGLGSVTAKNIAVYTPSCEKLAATKHCNGTDYWIVSHEAGTSNYRAYLLTAAGLNTSPVISNIGPMLGAGSNTVAAGQIKFSPTGKNMGAVGSNTAGLPSTVLFDFNRSTGVLSNSISLQGASAYGCEFSPDGSKFYGGGSLNNNSGIWQYDLCAGNASAIVASGTLVGSASTQLGSFQLAPDGKVYIARVGFTQSAISVIHNPNAPGAQCNYIDGGQTLFNGISLFGLPNISSSSLNKIHMSRCLTSSTATFYPPPFANSIASPCAYLSNSVVSVNWNFGDVSTGSLNVSSTNNAVHNFSAPGNYTVTLVINYLSGCAPDTLKLQADINTASLSVAQASATCNGLGNATVSVIGANTPVTFSWNPSSYTTQIVNGLSTGIHSVNVTGGGCTLTSTVNISSPATISINTQYTSSCTSATVLATGTNGSGSYSYTWSPGSTFLSNPIKVVYASGVYTITVEDYPNNCLLTKTVQISLLPAASITVSGNFSLCPGGSSTFTASGSSTSYTWTGSVISTTCTITSPGNYLVSGTSSLGCYGVKQFIVHPAQNPNITLAGNFSICAGSSATITANGANTYTWNPSGTTGSVVVLSPMINTVYTVVGTNSSGCIGTKTTSILVGTSIPTITIAGNPTLCAGSTATLVASGANTYTWSGPSPVYTPSNVVNPIASTVYSVTGLSASGCENTSTYTVTVYPIPPLTVTNNFTLCVGESAILTVGGANSYSWSMTNSTAASVIVRPTTNTFYTVIGTNTLGCKTSKTISVSVSKCLDIKEENLVRFRVFTQQGNSHRFFVQAQSVPVDYQLFVRDMAGRILFEMSVNSTFDPQPTFDLNVSGIYLVSFKKKDGIIETMKIIVD